MKTTIEQMRLSKVSTTPSIYCNTYLSMNDLDAYENVAVVYIYLDTYTIERMTVGYYRVVIGNGEYEFDTITEAEDYLWEYFLRRELNGDSIEDMVDDAISKLYKRVADDFDLEDGSVSPEEVFEMKMIKQKIERLMKTYVKFNNG